MGFRDIFKRKRSEFLETRELNIEYESECSQCGIVQVFYSDVNIFQYEHNIYVLLHNNFTGEFDPVKLPSANIKLTDQEEYVVDNIYDRVEEGFIELSRERMSELMLTVQCQNCGTEFPYIIATAIISNEQGDIMLTPLPDLPQVYSLPIAILGYDSKEDSFELHSILRDSS